MNDYCIGCGKSSNRLINQLCKDCWDDSANKYSSQTKEMKNYNCPSCGQRIFTGNVSRLAMTCPHCNRFVKIP